MIFIYLFICSLFDQKKLEMLYEHIYIMHDLIDYVLFISNRGTLFHASFVNRNVST